MSNYQQFILLLDQWGLRDILLPFILIFTFMFAMLQRISLFKQGGTGADADKPNKKINAVIAAGIGFAALTPHFTGRGFDIIIFINQFLPQSFLLLFIVLLFLALVGSVTNIDAKLGTKPGTHPLVGMIALVAVVTFVLILLQSTQQINYPFLNFLNDPNTQAITIVALVFILVVWYIAKKDTPTAKEEYFTKFKQRMGKLFG